MTLSIETAARCGDGHEHLAPFEPAEQIMGMPAAADRRWTAAEVRALMDESRSAPRYELVDGQLLVTPSPRPVHQWTVQLLYRLLDDYTSRLDLGWVLASPADLELEPESIVQPDLFVIPRGEQRPTTTWAVVKRLMLAVEVLSPSSGRIDRVVKRRFLQRVGVPEYWVADPEARIVERWTPDDERPLIIEERLVWQPAGAREPLAVDLPLLFGKAWGE
jgi:Uma2 family endonuclease